MQVFMLPPIPMISDRTARSSPVDAQGAHRGRIQQERHFRPARLIARLAHPPCNDALPVVYVDDLISAHDYITYGEPDR